jgi:hypothetical protein
MDLVTLAGYCVMLGKTEKALARKSYKLKGGAT